jgi:hypothetical protein
MISGVVHGNINLETIRIGDMHGPPGTRGVLVENQHSSVRSVLLIVIVVADSCVDQIIDHHSTH